MSSESPPPATDDFLSLEDLVRETPAAAAPQGPPVAEAVATIDKVLEVEDPGFASEAKALKDAGASPEADVVVDSDVDQLVEAEKAEHAAKGRKKLVLLLFIKPWRKFIHLASVVKALGPWLKITAIPATKTGAIKTLSGLKIALAWTLGTIKTGVGWFGKKSKQSKLLIVGVVVFAVAAIAMTRIALRGPFLPRLEKDFLTSFADGADQSFKYAADEKMQDLNDPLLHPEHIVLLERLIVNLRAPGDGTNPMALLDLYVEAGTQDTAIEIKDRDSEVRDMVLRTAEQMTYNELVTDSGKNKLKVFLRKNLNDMLSQGRVRRLFFKSIVLKP